MPIEVTMVLTPEEILEELNAIVNVTNERLKGLNEQEHERRQTAQLIAVGALFSKWMSDNPADSREQFATISRDVAAKITAGE